MLTERLGVTPRRTLPGEALLNHMPGILVAVADFLDGKLDVPIDSHVRADLGLLADLRRKQGWDAAEVIAEFGILGHLVSDEIVVAIQSHPGEASHGEVARLASKAMGTIHQLGIATTMRFRIWDTRDAEERARLLGTYTAILSHELASRLGAAETALQLILRDGKQLSEERLRRLHELTLQSIQSGSATMQGVHALFASHDPSSTGSSSRFPLASLVRDIVHQVRIGALARGIQIQVVQDGADMTVDAERFPLALYNLVHNAVRHHDTPDGSGTVRLEVSGCDDAILVTVRDDGPGLGDAVRARVFSPDIRDPAAEHAGLGLAIAWEAIRQMNGSLSVDPPNGRGTTFRIRVPVAEASSGA
ncbi:MAG: HAMP domain-containing sensor histidine kinase [Gemmatimonadota bacterium]